MPDLYAAGQDVTTTQLNTYRPFIVGTAAITANSATCASTTEVAVITSSSMTLKNGRAYKFVIEGLVQQNTVSVTDIVYFRLRRTSTVGTAIRNFNTVSVTNRATASRNTTVLLQHTGVNNSGADISDVIVFTMAWDTGSTSTFTCAASAGTPMTLQVWDVGPSSDFTNFTAIT